MKYNFNEFEKDFPDDAACLEYIYRARWPKGAVCVDEFAFRYSNRYEPSLFDLMLSRTGEQLSGAA